MKLILALSILFIAVNAATDVELWTQFKHDYGKTYKSLVEEKFRYSVFQSTLKQIEEHNTKYNNGEVSYFLKVNQFADVTEQEFAESYLTFQPSTIASESLFAPDDTNVPHSIDWREKGAVLEVRDQGRCASCWAFSMTGAIEGQNAIIFNKRVKLSDQELVDCNSLRYGCLGGEMIMVYKDLFHKTLFTEDSYPYKGVEGVCKKGVDAGVRVQNYTVIAQDEEHLKNAVGTLGPVTIGISGQNIKQYGGGIFNDPDCSQLMNHAVLAVGYGTKDGQDYWIVKNSWGVNWGEKGFIYMSRNKDQQCGISKYSVIPTVEI